MMRFTHFIVVPGDGADLLAGDVTACLHCQRPLFRDHLFISDGEEETAGEIPTVEAQIARGRTQLPDNALRMDQGSVLCEGYDRADGILPGQPQANGR